MRFFDRKSDHFVDLGLSSLRLSVSQLPRFCARCGEPLVHECEPAGYDERTGAPVFTRWMHCPRYKGARYKLTGSSYNSRAREPRADWLDWAPDSFPYTAPYHDCSPEITAMRFPGTVTSKPKPRKATKPR